jgi:hypothetical protein
VIVERNTFRLKFGKAKESIALWKEIMEDAKKHENPPQMRMMTDLSGTSYTLVVEMMLKSFMDINPKNYVWVTNPVTQDLYHRFIPLCDSATREYFKIEMEI